MTLWELRQAIETRITLGQYAAMVLGVLAGVLFCWASDSLAKRKKKG